MRDNRQLVILTTPHEKCQEVKTNHYCDTYAIKLANKIREVVPQSIIFHGDINRTSVDLNRTVSRDTDFRKNIRKKIRDQIEKILSLKLMDENKFIYVIDCHSFPANDFENLRIKNPDVALLFNSCLQLSLMEELTDTLKDNGISATKFLGGENDIIREADSFNSASYLNHTGIKIITVLVEVNETVSDYKLNMVGQSIATWINKVNQFLLSSSSIRSDLYGIRSGLYGR